jgi:GTP-binding protein
MKKILFAKGQFLQAAPSESTFPAESRFPEMAIVGKSNVGKSSLINHLLNNKKLAKTSATPGKTQMLNFFMIDEALILVDLPGYGFASVPHAVKKEWSTAIDAYFEKRQTLRLTLLLIDIRRSPSDEDVAFAKWAAHHEKPLLVIFTKSDKVTAAEKQKSTADALGILGLSFPHLHYSIKDPGARPRLITTLNQLLDSHGTHQ